MSFPQRETLEIEIICSMKLSELLSDVGPKWDTSPESIQFWEHTNCWIIQIQEKLELYRARLDKHIEELKKNNVPK